MKNLPLLAIIFFSFNIYAQIKEHQEIKGPFKTPQEVTQNCLSCHEDAADQVMSTSHWTWLSSTELKIPGHDKKVKIGKKDVFNNYCINLNSNWPRCTSCHVGYGWKDADFDFSKAENVDCLVCHDHTEKYKKSPAGSGMPDPKVDLLEVARNIGAPTIQSCGSCHFYGGGGENVKHGDLEAGLTNPDLGLDVHMSENEMLCQDCHETDQHQIKGVALAVTPETGGKAVGCLDCHETPVHENKEIEKHAEKIACQTCHIPEFAKASPTKMYWDWSDAGKDLKSEKDQYGKPTFHKKKGSFEWEKNVEPEYKWYNGESKRYLIGDKVNESGITSLNYPLGKRDDKKAKISPFKVHRGKQISDAKYKYLIVPHLWGGFWKDFDWNKASETGMKSVNLPYSGEYEFVETEMFWPLNHEIVKGEQALKCLDCHGVNGRMKWMDLGYDKNPASAEEIEKMKEEK